jgi:hypothetical protein
LLAPASAAHDLFHPTPAAQMRALTTDRPDQTEGPFTVDPGHVQLEMGVVGFTRDERDGERREDWSFVSSNLRVGLLEQLDAHLLFDPFVLTREEHAGGGATRGAGFGELATRVKWNLWGNDGGRTALALLPWVQWPLAASDTREGVWKGGLIVPFALELGGGWSAGAQTAVEWIEDRDGGVDTDLVNSVSLGRGLGERLAFYVEFFSRVHAQASNDWQGQLDSGLTWALGPNLQLDLGCDFGVTGGAPDAHPFVGLSVRR